MKKTNLSNEHLHLELFVSIQTVDRIAEKLDGVLDTFKSEHDGANAVDLGTGFKVGDVRDLSLILKSVIDAIVGAQYERDRRDAEAEEARH